MNEFDTVICRCEEVTLQELLETAKTYQCSSRELKLRTRAGMGFCGGRTCRPLVDRIVEKVAKRPADPHMVPLGYQPPVRPVTFRILGWETDEWQQD